MSHLQVELTSLTPSPFAFLMQEEIFEKHRYLSVELVLFRVEMR